MLIDYPSKISELIVDGLILGDIKLTDTKNKSPILVDQETKFIDSIVQYITARLNDKDVPKETSGIVFLEFLGLRLMGGIIGILQDRDYEGTVKTLEKDNEELSKLIEGVYIPSPDPKVGTQ